MQVPSGTESMHFVVVSLDTISGSKAQFNRIGNDRTAGPVLRDNRSGQAFASQASASHPGAETIVLAKLTELISDLSRQPEWS